ncbi:MAG: malonate transporter subunit MadL [Verrucomicrobiota bacterium]
MAIYGTAILSFCLITGLFIGRSLGAMLGIGSDVGGVGIGMLLLILVTDRMRRSDHLKEATEAGIQFWSALYVPIIVAMAAGLNVRAAITSGPAAILAGTLTVVACLALVPLVGRIGKPGPDDQQTPSA